LTGENDQGVIDKLAEEVAEFKQAKSTSEKNEEFGISCSPWPNIARRRGIELEVALREANQKFYNRFTYMEAVCKKRGVKIGELSFKEQNDLWTKPRKKHRKYTKQSEKTNKKEYGFIRISALFDLDYFL